MKEAAQLENDTLDRFPPHGEVPFESHPALHHSNKRPPQGRSFVVGGAGEIRPAALGQCRRQLGELKSHPPDAFSPSRGGSLRIPPALHHNNKRPPQGRSFVVGGAGEIRTHGRLSTVTRFPAARSQCFRVHPCSSVFITVHGSAPKKPDYLCFRVSNEKDLRLCAIRIRTKIRTIF